MCQARCRETWMRWNGFYETHRLHPTEYLKHLEPRAHEKKLRVARVKCARCGVLFTNKGWEATTSPESSMTPPLAPPSSDRGVQPASLSHHPHGFLPHEQWPHSEQAWYLCLLLGAVRYVCLLPCDDAPSSDHSRQTIDGTCHIMGRKGSLSPQSHNGTPPCDDSTGYSS